MQLKYLNIFVIIFFITIDCHYCLAQIKYTKSLVLGYSILEQDRRLFDLPGKDDIIKKEKYPFDHQYEALFGIHLISDRTNYVQLNLGYSLYKSKFSRPFNHNYFSGGMNLDGRYFNTYLIHSIKLGLTPALNIIKVKGNIIFINFPLAVDFPVNKMYRSTNKWHDNKWKIELSRIELLSGIQYAMKKSTFSINYRVVNFQKIDEVIFNDLIYSGIDSDFLSKKYEFHNPLKFTFNLSYTIQ